MSMDNGLGQAGVLQVIPEAQLQQQEQQRYSDQAAANQQAQSGGQDATPLIGWVKSQFEIFRNHRNTAAGWSERLLVSLRTSMGQYDATKLQEIRKWGGSDIYARISAQKGRAASSLLRDIYLGQDRPWGIRPPANPKVPDNVTQAIDSLMQKEGAMVQQQLGKPPQPTDVQARKTALLESAMDAAKKKAVQQARDSENAIEDMLRDGGFYHALSEFLVDLPKFPFAVMKGPVVKVIPEVQWPPGGGGAQNKFLKL